MGDVLAGLDRIQARINTGVTSADFLTPIQEEFIEYMLTIGHGSQAAFAEEHGMNKHVLTAWKKSRFFMEEWEKRAKKLNGGVERTQRVMDALYDAAVHKGDTKAASLWLQAVERFTPTRKVIEESSKVEDLSDEELAASMARLLKGKS